MVKITVDLREKKSWIDKREDEDWKNFAKKAKQHAKAAKAIKKLIKKIKQSIKDILKAYAKKKKLKDIANVIDKISTMILKFALAKSKSSTANDLGSVTESGIASALRKPLGLEDGERDKIINKLIERIKHWKEKLRKEELARMENNIIAQIVKILEDKIKRLDRWEAEYEDLSKMEKEVERDYELVENTKKEKEKDVEDDTIKLEKSGVTKK